MLALKQILFTLLAPLLGFGFLVGIPVVGTDVPSPPHSAASAVFDLDGSTTTPPALVPAPTPAASREPLITAAALQACLAESRDKNRCLDRIFRQYLQVHSTREVLAIMRELEASDFGIRLSCHPVMHAIGRETFRKTGTVHDSFVACDQTCHSGCYHGAMERFLRGDAADDDLAGHLSLDELKVKTAAACDPTQPNHFRFQCLHGLGHAVVFFSDYRLRDSLAACDALGDAWSRSSCYGGAFMENVHSATPEKRDLSPTDYHYPCSALDQRYRPDCYMMQTTRMTEMGLAPPQLFEECRKAGAERMNCMQSIGRDLSNEARVGKPRDVSQKCELGAGEERRACTRGVVYALIDNTWDGRYAFPLCETFTDAADGVYCFRVSRNYLSGMFRKTPQDIAEDCNRYAPQTSACRSVE